MGSIVESWGRKAEGGEVVLFAFAVVVGEAGERVSEGSSDSTSSLRVEAWVVGLKEPPPPKGLLPGNLDSAIWTVLGSLESVDVVCLVRKEVRTRLRGEVRSAVGEWRKL